MTTNNGRDLARIRAEALELCGGMDTDRARLVAVAMHANICNLSHGSGWPGGMWYAQMAQSAVRAADAVIAEMEVRQ